MKAKAFWSFFPFLLIAPVLADENPFIAVRDTDQWAIEQVMEHKAPDDTGSGTVMHKSRLVATATPFQAQTYRFDTETDQAKLGVTVADTRTAFVINVTSDQIIEGWLLKKQSTREVLMKGGAPDNPYQCQIRVERPYLKDFGLTVYVTQDNDPAFVQLF